jgi:hypothetical protein
MAENAQKLVFVPLEEEQPLQNFDIFKAYASLVERQLEEFILSEGLTVKVCAPLRLLTTPTTRRRSSTLFSIEPWVKHSRSSIPTKVQMGWAGIFQALSDSRAGDVSAARGDDALDSQT